MIICDDCKKEFLIMPIEQNHAGNIVETYFECPHCGKHYISYFTDKVIRNKQKYINKLWKEYRNAGTDKDEADEIMKKINKTKASIKILMDNLKIKMLGTQ